MKSLRIAEGAAICSPISNASSEAHYEFGIVAKFSATQAFVKFRDTSSWIDLHKIEALDHHSDKHRDVARQNAMATGEADEVTTLLKGESLLRSYEIVAERLGVHKFELQVKYDHLNDSMQKMCLCNRLRAHLRRCKTHPKQKNT